MKVDRVAAVLAAIIVAFAMGCRREEPKPPPSPPTPQTAPQPPAAPPASAPQPGAATPAEQGRTVSQTLDDAGVTAKVKASLLASPDVKGTDVNVSTEQGMVRLTGSLDAQSQIDRAVQIARGTEGVKQVESSLTVKSAK